MTSVNELIHLGLPRQDGHQPTVMLDVNMVTIGNVSPLMYAVEYNHVDIYTMLIENGADPTVKDIQGHDAYHYVKLNHPKSDLVNITVEGKRNNLLQHQTIRIVKALSE